MVSSVCIILSFFLHCSLSLDNSLARLPPMGWTTWCTDNGIIPCYDDYCNQDEVTSVASSMVMSGLVDLGYNYIILDDCWAGGRDNTTHVVYPDATRFPSGMKALADFIHSLGMKLGLYTDAGTQTCRGGRPGSWPYYDLDAMTYASWGIDYIKMDYCDHPAPYTPPQIYAMMRDALNKTGRPILYSVCEWGLDNPWTWGMETANMWRAGPDHIPLWWSPDSPDPGTAGGTGQIIQHFAGISSYAGPGGWNDPDFLMPGYFWNSEIDDVTEFSFWCLFAAPLIVATDVRVLSNKQVILNKEAIAINQDPLGKPGDLRVNNSDGGQIWSRPLSNNAWAVILFNHNNIFGDVNLVLIFTPQILPGWPIKITTARVRDIWKEIDHGIVSNFTVSLVPHQSVMLQIGLGNV